jgi:hypothetical protein
MLFWATVLITLVAAVVCATRYRATGLVILVPAIIGEAVFLVLAAHRDPNDYDAGFELAVGAGVAGVLALAASLIFLRSRVKSLGYAVLAAALIIPFWYAFAIVSCLVGDCGYS